MAGQFTRSSKRVEAHSKSSNLVVNSVALSRDLPVFTGFFEIIRVVITSDNGKSVQQCPAGYAPIRCSYTERTSRIRAYFKSEHCMGCDHREECQAKQRRATCQMSLSRSAVERARQQQQMHAPDFQNWHRIRNGIESVPSILRNRYQVDKMPVRGFIPSKFFFEAKISAMNFNKLLRHRRGLLSCAQNPLLS